MPPHYPQPPTTEGADPHRVWVQWVIAEISENLDSIKTTVELLSTRLSGHIAEEGNQYRAVESKLDEIKLQSKHFEQVVEDFKICKTEFKEHVKETKPDHDQVRFASRFVLWVAGAFTIIAGNFQLVLPLLERLLGHP